jgi:PAS domain S-box-containing protein
MAHDFRPEVSLVPEDRPSVSSLPAQLEVQQLRAMVALARDAIIAADQNGRVTFWNPAAQELFGYSAAEAVGQPLTLIIAERFRARHESALRRLGADEQHRGAGQTGELVGLCKDGKEVPIELSLAAGTSTNGPLFTAVVRDVSERRRVDEARRWLAAVVESSSDAIISLALDGTIVSWNRGAERMFGWTSGEVVGRSIMDFAPEQQAREFGELALRMLGGESIESFESVRFHKTGARIDVSLALSPVHDDTGQLIGTSFVVRDVTEQKLTERTLREMSASLEHAVEGIARLDAGGRYTSVNRAYAAAGGYEPEELVGLHWDVSIHPDDRALIADAHRRMLDTGKADAETRGVRKDGSAFYWYVHLVAAFDEHGKFQGHHCFAKDVTERKTLQAQLVLSDRMVSVGTLAAGVAHEINNPLAYVITNLDLIAEELRTNAAALGDAVGDLGDLVLQARSGADRVRKIVRELKIFSRADEERRRPLELHRVVDLAINMSFNEIRHRARLVKEYHAAPLVDADEPRLAQVFINLLVNAAQAMMEGYAHCNEIRVIIDTDASGRAMIEVRDTGPGIPPDVLSRIFDPFFTTKPVGVGTGLGLSICHGIVSALGGEVQVESVVGKGSSFRVLLPVASLEARPSEHPKPASVISSKRARVLVVDDDPLVGACLKRGLSAEHDVTLARDGRAALELIVVGENYDVILCDLMMPIMTGMDLYDALCEVAPDQAERMVFVSGGAFTPTCRDFVDRVPNERLDKPFDIKNVRAVVRRLAR